MHNLKKLLSALAAIGLLTATPVTARAQAPASAATIADQLNRAAVDGPAALLHQLDLLLAQTPSLAASPSAAASLARAAAAPVPDFIGATMPVYRAIGEKIVVAAPAAQRDAVASTVDGELTRLAETDPRTRPVMPTWERGALATGQPEPITRGYRVGSFTIYPDVKSGIFYDDNIFATKSARKSDWVGTISPRVIVQSNWERHELVAEAQTDLTGYLDHSTEKSADWHASAEGRIDAAKTTQFLLGGLALQDHEDRASPDAVQGLTPTPYTQLNAYAGAIHRIGFYTLRFGTSFENLTFDDVDSAHGEIDNQDRNRNRIEVGGLARYDLSPVVRPYVEATGVFHNYQRQFDDFGYERSSQGAKAGVGALLRFTAELTGDAFVGAITRDYDDPTFKTHMTPTADGYLRWQPTSRTATVLFFDRSLEETTLPGSPGYLYNILGGRLEQALTAKLTGILRAAVARSTFIQSSRIDDEGDFSVGLRYSLTDNLTVGCDYRYTTRSSTDSTVDYGRNQFFFRVSTAF
jgi:hypothetical protein